MCLSGILSCLLPFRFFFQDVRILCAPFSFNFSLSFLSTSFVPFLCISIATFSTWTSEMRMG